MSKFVKVLARFSPTFCPLLAQKVSIVSPAVVLVGNLLKVTRAFYWCKKRRSLHVGWVRIIGFMFFTVLLLLMYFISKNF
jgi:hypothetical protein